MPSIFVMVKFVPMPQIYFLYVLTFMSIQTLSFKTEMKYGQSLSGL